MPTRGGRARDRTERPVPVHDLLSRLERRVAFEQRQPALGLAEEMRARDDLLARVAALLHAVGVQALERELLRRPFLDLRLRKSRQAMGKLERRPAGARIELDGVRQSRPGSTRARAAAAPEIGRANV